MFYAAIKMASLVNKVLLKYFVLRQLYQVIDGGNLWRKPQSRTYTCCESHHSKCLATTTNADSLEKQKFRSLNVHLLRTEENTLISSSANSTAYRSFRISVYITEIKRSFDGWTCWRTEVANFPRSIGMCQ